MGLFDFLKRICKKQVESHNEIQNFANPSTFSERWSNNLCSENAHKKHFLMYMLLDPDTCFFKCRDLKEKGKIDFFYKDKKIYTMGNDITVPVSIFALLLKTIRNNQDDFTRFFEILNRSHLDYYSSTLLLSPEELVEKIQYYFQNFSLANNPHEIKVTLEWTYIDICVMHKFFLEISQYIREHLFDKSTKKVDNISDCTSLENLKDFFLCMYQSKL